ncbi:MAG: uroporphyrinogen-III synthase [Emcibacteraceae bacterium]|nr:uroporphyrinogen-III synthase [Emcibacteraceae bacterium]
MRFLLTRPKPECEALGQKLSAMEHNVVIDPLMTVKNIPLLECDINQYQALVFTSVNGLRNFHQQFGAVSKPLFVVGNKTYNMAKFLGFTDISSADGDAKKLATLLKSTLSSKDGAFLYLSAKHVSQDLDELLSDSPLDVDRQVIYDIVPATTLSKESIVALENKAIDYIPFYSERSALIFMEMINKHNLQHYLLSITALCLSKRVADALNQTDWRDIKTAENPRESDLFNLIAVSL